MKPIRKYHVAWICFKSGDEYEEFFEVEVYNSMVIYMDKDGNERINPLGQVRDIVQYASDRGVKDVN